MVYVVIVEKARTGFCAFVPDLPGCVAVDDSREETVQRIREAIELHNESFREHGESVPAPSATVETVVVNSSA